MVGQAGDGAAGVLAEDIDLGFVPVRADSTVHRHVDSEVLVINRERGTVHLLNATGSIVWEWFDGDTDLAVLVDDLAAAFQAPTDVVGEDLLALTRSLAAVGLLDGIARPQPVVRQAATGLEVGDELVAPSLVDLDGSPAALAEYLGREVLLVNWSPSCGFCVKIAGDLAELQDDLDERDVTLVFLAVGDDDANRQLLEKHQLRAPTFQRDPTSENPDDPFAGMGTPVAYLLDRTGKVAAPLAYGAIAVPGLARRAAGQGEPAAARTDVRYLPSSGGEGVCGPGARARNPRVWNATATYRVAEYHLGIRTDSAAADELVGDLLAAHRTDDDPNAPANFSVVLGAGSTNGSGTRSAAKELGLLLRDNTTIVRSRSGRRVLLGLAAHLTDLATDWSDLGTTVPTWCLPLIHDGEAVLLPRGLIGRLEQLQPRLARAGLRVADVSTARVDLVAGELIVPEPLETIDVSVLDSIRDTRLGRTELPRVEPGRYRLRAWGTWAVPSLDADPDQQPDAEEAAPTRASRVSMSLTDLAVPADRLVDFVDPLASLFDRLPPLVLSMARAERITEQIRQQLNA